MRPGLCRLFYDAGLSSLVVLSVIVNELERIWKDATVGKSRCFIGICLERLRKTTISIMIVDIPAEIQQGTSLVRVLDSY